MAVTPDVISVALGRTAPAIDSPEWQQWDMFIADALMLIEARRVQLDVAGPLDEATLDYVVREAVVAHIRHPDDATQVTVGIGDASSSRTYRSGKGRVTIPDDLWALLGLTTPTGGAFSVDTAGTGIVHADWCALNFGANYCDCGAILAGYPIFGQSV